MKGCVKALTHPFIYIKMANVIFSLYFYTCHKDFIKDTNSHIRWKL
jgi:hypothetical protein